MKTEHFYTGQGVQRFVVTETYGQTVCFSLENAPEGSFVEMTDNPVELVRTGKASWFKMLDLSAPISGATALRVTLAGRPEVYARLSVETATDPVMGCAGWLARMNAVLAAANAHMRFCAWVA